jgi:hypothetical protein
VSDRYGLQPRCGGPVAWIFVLAVVAVTVETRRQERVQRATGLLAIRTPAAGTATTDALSVNAPDATLLSGPPGGPGGLGPFHL